MFFKIKIMNDENKEIFGSEKLSDPITEYFACCVSLAIDMLQGAFKVNLITSDNAPVHREDLQKKAITIFKAYIVKHPEFVTKIQALNKEVLNNIHLLGKQPQNESIYMRFVEELQKIKIEGIKSIKICRITNQEVVTSMGFPAELIPRNYICQLSNKVMDEPCLDKAANIMVDKHHYNLTLAPENKLVAQNTSTNKISVDLELKEKIIDFLIKIQMVEIHFPDYAREKYEEYIDQITGNVSIKNFKTELQEDKKLCLECAAETNYKTLSTKAIEIYYKQNKLKEAAVCFNQAIVFIKITKQSNSELYAAYSNLISCYRDQKQYGKAVKIANLVLDKFFDALNLESVIKKREQCIALLAQNVLVNGGADQFDYNNLLNKFISAAEKFTAANMKSKLAMCYLNIATIYQELGQVSSAMIYTTQALRLQVLYLPDDEKLIELTANKLSKLYEAAIVLCEKNKQALTGDFFSNQINLGGYHSTMFFLHRVIEKTDKAVEHHQQALSFYRKGEVFCKSQLTQLLHTLQCASEQDKLNHLTTELRELFQQHANYKHWLIDLDLRIKTLEIYEQDIQGSPAHFKMN